MVTDPSVGYFGNASDADQISAWLSVGCRLGQPSPSDAGGTKKSTGCGLDAATIENYDHLKVFHEHFFFNVDGGDDAGIDFQLQFHLQKNGAAAPGDDDWHNIGSATYMGGNEMTGTAWSADPGDWVSHTVVWQTALHGEGSTLDKLRFRFKAMRFYGTAKINW